MPTRVAAPIGIAIALLSFGFVFALSLEILSAQETRKAPDPSSRRQQLPDRVDKLEEKVARLNMEVDELDNALDARTKNIANLQERVAELEIGKRQTADNSTKIKIFSLENAEAPVLTQVLDNLFQRAWLGEVLGIESDPRTNSIIVIARQEQLEKIEALVQRLDEPENTSPVGLMEDPEG